MARPADRSVRALVVVAACVAGRLLTPASACAQSEDRAIEVEDLGFTAAAYPGARAYAISAPAALTSDPTALVYNPAGLSRIKRPVACLSLGWRDRDYDYRYDDGSQSTASDASGIDFAGAAFPIPVMRGSLVPALSVHRAFSSDLALRYSGLNVPDDRNDTFYLQQSGATYAYTLGVSVDVADVVSLGGAISLLEGNIDLLRQYDYHAPAPQPPTRTFVLEDAQLDVTGVVGRLGIEIYAHRHLQLAVVMASRQPIDVSGAAVRETITQIPNDVGTYSRETTTLSTEYVLPYRIDVALAAPWKRVTVAAQVGYTDWSQTTIAGHRISTQGGETVLRSVYDLRGGIEWSPPVRGLRVRAGIAYARGALTFMQADRVDDDRLESVASESGRTRVSLGAGLLLGAGVSVDVALENNRGERESETVGDRLESTGVLLQGSCWF